MRINRLSLRQFRRHDELDIELAPGLTVVRGPNEAGKTTLQRAVELVLTRRVTSSSNDIDGFRTWGGQTGADVAIPRRAEELVINWRLEMVSSFFTRNV